MFRKFRTVGLMVVAATSAGAFEVRDLGLHRTPNHWLFGRFHHSAFVHRGEAHFAAFDDAARIDSFRRHDFRADFDRTAVS